MTRQFSGENEVATKAERALEIANAESERLAWGSLTSARYQARQGVIDGRAVWFVGMRQIMIGKQVRFTIDAETGEILDKRWQGPR